MKVTETGYKLDKQNRITEVSSGWDDFALQNKGEDATSSRVVGTTLREFIVGDATRMWMKALVDSVRASNKEVIKFYRCDSPSEKRFMRMTLLPDEDGSVYVSNKLIRVEKMKRSADFRFEANATLERCSLCNRVLINDAWIEADEIPDVLNLRDGLHIEVTYSICNKCGIQMM